MSTEVLPDAYASCTRPMVGVPHAALRAQQAAAAERVRLLRRAQPSGQRLVSALYLVLDRHDAVSVMTDDGQVHLSCIECRPQGHDVRAQFPCATAQQAMWALDAVLG